MKKWKLLLLVLVTVLVMPAFSAPKEKKEHEIEPKRVYLCGVSLNFNDSVVYVTDIQYLDSVVINNEGSLANYSSYTMQMKIYMQGTLGEGNQTCAVLYSEDKKKLEKRVNRMRKHFLTNENKLFKKVSREAFAFRKEQ